MTPRTDDPVARYTRANAIDDGVLVEVPDQLAKEAGFEWPVGYTETVHLALWMPKSGCHPNAEGQTYEGRLRDVLNVAAQRLRGLNWEERPPTIGRPAPSVSFEMTIANPGTGVQDVHRLEIAQGSDSRYGPYLTIMLAED